MSIQVVDFFLSVLLTDVFPFKQIFVTVSMFPCHLVIRLCSQLEIFIQSSSVKICQYRDAIVYSDVI